LTPNKSVILSGIKKIILYIIFLQNALK
jgi:hypothetical protein